MSVMNVRPSTPEDDAVVGQLLVDAFNARYAQMQPPIAMPPGREHELRDVAGKRAEALVLVAEREGDIVGTVALFPPGAPHNRAWIRGDADLRHLATLPRLHGQGLSTALLDAAERQARAWGAPGVCLHVRRENTGLVGLYQRRGYALAPEGDLDQLPKVYLVAMRLALT